MSVFRVEMLGVHVANVGTHLGDVLEDFDETFVKCG